MSETASRAARIMWKMSATSMLKGVVCRIGDSSLDSRSLGELDCSQERQQYSDESVNTKTTVAESVREDYRSTVGLGIRKEGPKDT
jgi:hypothetical protein